MKTLRLDPASGIAGDMFLGLLVDLGAPEDAVRAAIVAAAGAEADLRVEKIVKQGLAATKATVLWRGRPADDHEDHGHASPAAWPAVRERLNRAGFIPNVRDRSLAAFEKLFAAEAEVHGEPLDRIHLHEAGAVDALGEIAGAAAALEALGVTRITHAPLPWPRGTIRMRHGLYPNPAPATAALLKGRRTYAVDECFELITPTGAAILAAWAEEDLGVMLAGERIGHGAGTADLARANVLRGVLGREHASERVAILETNLDDVTPETLGFLVERLLAAGALDATLTPLCMKKQRSGNALTVICRPEDASRHAETIFAETRTLGLRIREETRLVEERRIETVKVDGMEIRVTISRHGRKPEYEDVRRAALASGRPFAAVSRAAVAASLGAQER